MRKVNNITVLLLGALSISTVGSTAIINSDSVSAKTTYKIVKKKLVNAKTGKRAKGLVVYKKKLYKNGILTKKPILYKKKLYNKGVLVNKYTLYKGKLYKKGGSLNKGVVLYNKKLYKDSSLYKGKKIYKNKMYVNGIYIKDRTKPTITLSNKQKAYTLGYGEEFTMPIATAKDNVNGNWTVKPTITNAEGKIVKSVNSTISGVYTIKFVAKDYAGNTSLEVITVTILDKEHFDVIEIN